jgi:hypothetical protein
MAMMGPFKGFPALFLLLSLLQLSAAARTQQA